MKRLISFFFCPSPKLYTFLKMDNAEKKCGGEETMYIQSTTISILNILYHEIQDKAPDWFFNCSLAQVVHLVKMFVSVLL